MKILVIADPHGYSNYKKSVLKKADIILIPGDLGKADLARKWFFENIKREAQGLPKLELTPKQAKKIHMEVHDSTINLLKTLSKYASVYTLEGNVGIAGRSRVREDYEDYGIKFPCTLDKIKKMKKVHLVKNQLRVINGLRIGFLEYFVDTSWIREFKPSDYREKLKEAKKETDKAKKILKRFKDLDILLCHQPPYGVLDKSNNPHVPKHWKGKHAGSKAILGYVKKEQPRYVFCGHMHESKGKKKIGKTEVYNVGFNGDYLLVDISKK